MGFRIRKSIKLGKYARINLSKSGVGFSAGTKAFRYTKKAGGGSRTTSTLPGTGISYSQDLGTKKRSSHSPTTTNSQSSAPKREFVLVSASQKQNQGFNPHAIWHIYNRHHSVLWWIFVGWYLGYFLFYGWLVLLIVKALTPPPPPFSPEELLAIQKIIAPDSPDHLVMSSSQILDAARQRLSNDMRIIDESAAIAESTCDADTFFSRMNLILECYESCKAFEPYIEFSGYSPSEAYDQALSEREGAIERFIYRYVDKMTLDASKLKTERGKQNRYAKSFATLEIYKDQIDTNNWQLIEAEFKRIISE